MKDVYKVKIAGCERDLPICKVNEKLSIAAFIMFGDIEITEKCAKLLLKKSPEFDVLITSEAKGIPLCYEMAKQSGKKYLVARKNVKVYLDNPICVEVKSITTSHKQKLYLAQSDVKFLKNKKVLIVDDVISTGRSIEAIETLVDLTKGKVVSKATVFAEGDASAREDIIFLEKLPLF